MKLLFRDHATTDMTDEIPGRDVAIAFVNLPANHEDAIVVSLNAMASQRCLLDRIVYLRVSMCRARGGSCAA